MILFRRMTYHEGMKRKEDICKEKNEQQPSPVGPIVDRCEETEAKLRKFFRENRSLDPLALYAKFYWHFPA